MKRCAILTTTAAKMAHRFIRDGASVMLAAADTFRAAAIDQLKVWGGRVGAEVVARGVGADPAGVAYEALERPRAEKLDVLIIDTAGRLQNKSDLMAELAKIVRVLKKLDPQAPHSVVLVLDATTGQNALNQVQIFQEIAGVTSLVVTKLDGTARGGILVAVAERFGLPVNAIGVGEGIDDLAGLRCRGVCPRHRRSGREQCRSSLTQRRVRKRRPRSSGLALATKLAIELGPLLVFLRHQCRRGIYVATAVFMAATLVALGVAWWRYHKIPVMPLVSGAVVLVFGTLTLYLRDDTFIKLKPTIVYLTFAAFLGAGLLLRKPVLELLLGSVFNLTEPGWRKLTLRWALFFIAMAVLNELVWRNVSTDAWVSFKAFGFLPLTFIFAMAQMPLMQRYSAVDDNKSAGPELPRQ